MFILFILKKAHRFLQNLTNSLVLFIYLNRETRNKMDNIVTIEIKFRLVILYIMIHKEITIRFINYLNNSEKSFQILSHAREERVIMNIIYERESQLKRNWNK